MASPTESDQEVEFDTFALTPTIPGNPELNDIRAPDKDKFDKPADSHLIETSKFPVLPELSFSEKNMASDETKSSDRQRHSKHDKPHKTRPGSKTQPRSVNAGKSTPKGKNPFIEAIQNAPNKVDQVKATKLVLNFMKSGDEKNACLKFISQNFDECMMCVVCKKKAQYMFLCPNTKKCYCEAHKTDGCLNLKDYTTIREKK